MVVAFGPGGSGKTSLLDHVRHRCRDAPTAEVDLDKALLLDGIDPYLRPKRSPSAARSVDRRDVRPGPAYPTRELDGAEEGLSVYRTRKCVLEHNILAPPPASLPRQSTVGMFPCSRRWPPRNSVRRMAICSVVLLLVLYGAAFCLQNSAHCLHYGILEPTELVADFCGVRTRVSKMDGLQCVGLSEKPGRFAYGDPATQNNDEAE